MPVIPLELIDKYDAYVGRYVYLCGNENRERIDLRLVFIATKIDIPANIRIILINQF